MVSSKKYVRKPNKYLATFLQIFTRSTQIEQPLLKRRTFDQVSQKSVSSSSIKTACPKFVVTHTRQTA